MTMDVKTEWINIDVDGQPMRAYQALPTDGGTYPAVLVLMEIFGINDHIQDVTRRIAKEGYVALAIDYYHRVAPPGLNLGYTQAAIDEGLGYLKQTFQAGMLADANAAIAYLKQLPQVNPKDRLGTIGFCFGGHVAYVVATIPEIAATASFYGGWIANGIDIGDEPPVDKTAEIKGFMLCLFGEKDTMIPQSDIRMIESSMERAHVPHKLLVYPADHGFFCDKRPSYDPESAFTAWQEVKHLFNTRLKQAAGVH